MSGNDRSSTFELTPQEPTGYNEPFGRIVRLSDNRVVFVGERADDPDRVYVAFRNREGHERFLVLSREAMAALIQCANDDPGVPMEVGHFPYKDTHRKMIWKVRDRS